MKAGTKLKLVSRVPVRIDTGTKFGRWTVIDDSLLNYLRCRCECGTEKSVSRSHLKLGSSRSCGCLSREASIKAKTIHGDSHTPEYVVWKHMLDRCSNPKNSKFSDYGGRGISVCERWLSYENFLADMGRRPSPVLSLDRIDNNGNYEPSNCRWATRLEQQNNLRKNIKVTANGETLTIAAWARRLGMAPQSVNRRLKIGWDPVLAVTTPSARRSDS